MLILGYPSLSNIGSNMLEKSPKETVNETNDNLNPQDVLSLAEAAKISGYHQEYLGILCRAGKIPAAKIGRNWTIKRKDILAYKAGELKSTSTEPISPIHPIQPISPIGHISHIRPIKLISAITTAIVILGVVITQASKFDDRLPNLIDKGEVAQADPCDPSSYPSSNSYSAYLSYPTYSSHRPEDCQPTSEKPNDPQVLAASTNRTPPPLNFQAEEVRSVVEDYLDLLYANGLLKSPFSAESTIATSPTYPPYTAGNSSAPTPQPSSPSVPPVVYQPSPPPQIIYLPPPPPIVYGGGNANGNPVSGSSATFVTCETCTVNQQLKVNGTSTLEGSLTVNDNVTVTGNITHTGDLSVSGTISGSVSGSFNPSFTLGSIAFQGTSGLDQDNTGLFYDNTNNRLGLGTATPAAVLDIKQTTNGQTMIQGQRVTDTAPTGDFIVYKNAAGTNLYRVDNSGNVTASGSISGGAQTITTTTTPQLTVQYDANNQWTSSTSATGVTTFTFSDNSGVATGNRAVFKPQNNSTAAIQFQNAAGTNIFNIDTTNAALGVGTASINASALLQLDSTTKGFLPPRVTTVQKNAISSPAAGLLVYDSTLNKLNVYNGTTWKNVGSTEVGGDVENGTIGSVLFVGASTLLAQDNANFFWDDTTNRLGIGDNTPSAQLEVGNGTDSLQVSSVGDITFVDADGAASVTGPAGGALTVAAGAAQALTLTGNGASTWSTSSGALTLTSAAAATWSSAAGNLTVQGAAALNLTAAAGNVAITATGAGNDITLTSADDILVNPGDDVLTTLAAAGNFNIDASTTASTGTAQGVVDINVNTVTSDNRGLQIDYTLQDAASDATVYGQRTNITVDTDAAQSHTAYGQYISVTNNDASSTAYGLYVDAGTGAGTEYAAAFLNGNVSVGTTTPQTALHVDYSASNSNGITIGNFASGFYSQIFHETGNNKLSLENKQAGGIVFREGATTVTIDGNTLTANTNLILQHSGGFSVGVNDTSPDALFDIDSAATTTTVSGLLATALTTGIALDLSNTSTATTSADLLQGDHTATYTDTASVSGNLLDLTRALTINDAADTLTVSGSLASLSDNCTATAGTCTHTGDVLRLTQDYASASGALLNIDNGGAGYGLRVNDDGTATDSTPFIVDASGNVGIGTTTVGAKVRIVKTGAVAADGTTAALAVGDSAANFSDTIQFGTHISNYGWIQNTGGVPLYINPLGNNVIFNRDGGNVGIGETTPGSKLAVSGGVTVGAGYDTTTAPSNGLLVEGNVGLGETSPFTKLDLGTSLGNKLILYHNSSINDSPGIGIQSNLMEFNGGTSSLDYTFGYGTSGSLTRNVTIKGTGNVGIGSTSPGALLDVSASAQSIASATNAEYTTLAATAPTITLTGSTAVTTAMDSFLFNAPTIQDNDVTQVAITDANTLTISSPPISAGTTGVAITNAVGLRIGTADLTTGSGAVTNGYGLYVDAPTGATNNYAATFAGGNVGIGNTSPTALLSVGSSNQFRVNSSGAIAASTGVATSGSITSTITGTSDVMSWKSFDGNSTWSISLGGIAGNGGFRIVEQGVADRYLFDAGKLAIASVLQVGSISPAAYSRLGTGTTGHSLDAANDLLISDDLEVDGDAFFDGNITIAGTQTYTGSTTWTLDATEKLTVDAATTDHTDTSGAIDLDIDSSTTGVSGIDINIEQNSTATSSTTTVSGISISPVITAAGAGGTHEVVGAYIQAASGTAGAGTQNVYGLRIGNQGAGTNTETTYGLYVDSQTGGGTASYAAVFAGGNVGVGTTAPGAKLDVTYSSSNTPLAVRSAVTYSGNAAGEIAGFSSNPVLSGSGSAGNGFYGFLFGPTFNSSSTTTTVYGLWGRVNAQSGTIPNAYGAYFGNAYTFGGGGAITNNYGVYIEGATSGTNNVGLLIDEATGTKNTNLLIGTTTVPAGSYSIYNASSDNNYFAGNLGIGDVSPAALLSVGNGDLFQVDSSGRLFLPAGASGAGNLALSTTGDTNTGLYFSAADEIRVQTGGSDRVTINSVGDVGIGITSPSSKLYVQGSRSVPASGFQGIAGLYSTDALGAGVGAGLMMGGTYTGGTTTTFAQVAGVKENATDGDYNGALLLSTRTTSTGALEERMRITSTGNVGIGTTGPGNKLSINPPTTTISTTEVGIAASASTQKGLVIQGAASQTANLQEWQNSSGTTLSSINSSGKILAASVSAGGVATIPDYGFINDTNTGFYWRTADVFGWMTGGSHRGFFGSDGSLLINGSDQTTTASTVNGVIPRVVVNDASLQVFNDGSVGTDGYYDQILIRGNGTAGIKNAVRFIGNGNGNQSAITGITATDGSAGHLGFETASGGTLTEYMRITSGGNVGIGTTSPAGTLHVAGQCVTGDTKLRRRRRRKRADGTEEEVWEEVAIRDIQPGDEILTLDEHTGKLVPAQVKQLADMGVKQTYLLTTEDGRSIRTTANHPYLVLNTGNRPVAHISPIHDASWLKVSDIQPGDHIAVPKPRVGVFIDNSNLFYAQKQAGFKIDLLKIKTALTRVADLQVFNYYAAVPDESDTAYQGTISYLNKVGTFANLVTKPLKYIQIAKGKFEKKGDMDVDLALDAFIAAKNLDAIIVVSGDSDLVALRNKVLTETGKKFMFLGFKQGTAWEIKRGKYLEFNKIRKMVELDKKTTPELSLGRTLLSVLYAGEHSLSSEEFVWVKVHSIKPVAMEQVFDIEVEGTHNFIGNNIVAHNTAIFGQGHGGTPTATTIQGAAAAGTNIAGANLTFDASNGTGTGGSGAILFRTAPTGSTGSTANTLAEVMRITPSGNVGIGTTGPSTNLHVKGTTDVATLQAVNMAGNKFLSFDYEDGGASDYGNFQIRPSTLVLQSGNFNGRIQLTPYNGGVYSSSLGLIVEASGNVGIGETAPGSKLAVSGGATVGASYDTTAAPADGMLIQGTTVIGATSALAGKLEVYSAVSGGSSGGIFIGDTTAVAANIGGQLVFGGYYTGTTSTAWSMIRGQKENATDGNFAGYLALYTRPDGGSQTERLRIKSDGNVGIGTTSPDAVLELAGNKTASAWGFNGLQLQGTAATYTDSSTAASGTATNAVFSSFGQPTLAASNTSVTTTNAATVYIANSPTAGTNQTITNAYALWVDDGTARFDGAVTIAGATTYNGNITVTKADPSIILDTTTATDTDFWLGIQEDAGGDDDDLFQIGDGTTPGTNPFLTINTSGNVGIGTTNPASLLQLATTRYIDTSSFQMISTDSSGNPGTFAGTATGSLRLNPAASSGLGELVSYNDAGIGLQGYNQAGNTQFGQVKFNSSGLGLFTNNSERIRIDTSGNIGIGTTSPTALLNVQSSQNGYTQIFLENANAGSSAMSRIQIGNANNSQVDSLTLTTLGTSYASSGPFLQDGAAVMAESSLSGGLNVGTRGSTPLRLYTNDSEKLRIDSSGNVGIGTTAPGAKLDVTYSSSDTPLAVRSAVTYTGNASEEIVGFSSNPSLGGSGSAGNGFYGLLFGPTFNSSNLTTTVYGMWGRVNAQSGTIPTAYAAYFGNPYTFGGGGAVTNNYGVYIEGQTSGTNNVGLLINEATGTKNTNILIGTTTVPTGSYSIYNASSDNNYFAGNVGIGTTGPGAALDLQQNAIFASGAKTFHSQNTNSAGQASFYLENDRGSYTSYGGYLYGGSGMTSGNTLFGATRNDKLFMFADGTSNLGMYVGTLVAQPLVFGTNNAERVRIDSTGNVGIGTTTPLSKLDVTTAGLGTTQTTSSGLALVNTTAAAVGAQQISPAIRWSGFGWKTDATAASQAVDFRSFVTPVQGTSAPTGYLSFGSSVNGGAYSDGQLILTTAGNVGIGTTGPVAKLQVVGGNIHLDNNAGIRFFESDGATQRYVYSYFGDDAYIDTTDDTFFRTASNVNTVTILNTGNVGIIDATPTEAVLVVGSAGAGDIYATFATANSERLCWDGTGASLITDCTGTPGDYAEDYGSDGTLEAGDIVAVDPTQQAHEVEKNGEKGSKAWVKKADQHASAIIGIVSTDPNEVIGQNFTPEEHPVPVALNGRVPVKVTNENGPIKPGDYLTLSKKFPGYAAKAINEGEVIGRALEEFIKDPEYLGSEVSSGKVLVFVNITHYVPSVADLIQQSESLQRSNEFTTMLNDLSNLNITNAQVFGNLVVRDTLYVGKKLLVKERIEAAELVVDSLIAKKIKSEEVQTQKLCVDDVCVTKEQFKAMIEAFTPQQVTPPASSGSSTSGGAPESNSNPTDPIEPSSPNEDNSSSNQADTIDTPEPQPSPEPAPAAETPVAEPTPAPQASSEPAVN